MQVSRARLVEEERMINRVKRLGNVDCHKASAFGRLSLVEAVGDVGDSWEKRRRCRVIWSESMLSCGWRERGDEETKGDPF